MYFHVFSVFYGKSYFLTQPHDTNLENFKSSMSGFGFTHSAPAVKNVSVVFGRWAHWNKIRQNGNLPQPGMNIKIKQKHNWKNSWQQCMFVLFHLFPRMDPQIQPQFMHQYSNHQATLRRLFSICSNFHKLGPQYTKRLRVAMSRPILSTWSLGLLCWLLCFAIHHFPNQSVFFWTFEDCDF